MAEEAGTGLICEGCGVVFTPKNKGGSPQRYCEPACRLRANRKRRYWRHRESELARAREYYLHHREGWLARQREHYMRNRESELARMKEYYRRHREDVLARQREYNFRRGWKLARLRYLARARAECLQRLGHLKGGTTE